MLTVPDDEMPDSPDESSPAGLPSAGPHTGAFAPVPLWPARTVQLPYGPLCIRSAGPDHAQASERAIFVHGLGGSSTNWTDVMALLSASDQAANVLTCTALDLPGFGFSPAPPDADYSIWAHAQAVISLIEYLGTAPAHLVGNSMGGAVLTRVAAHRPDLVASLTLISPALPDLRPRPLPLRLAVVAAPGIGKALLDRINRQPAATRTDLTIGELFCDPDLMHPLRRDQEVAEVIRRDSLDYAGEALRLSARSLVAEYFRPGRRRLWADAAAVAAPTLIMHGSADRLVNPVMAVKAARTFRDSRIVILPGTGHVAMMEQPHAVAAEIQSFLESVRGRHVMNRVRC
jgi:pimeloyl-ACP methyl ester carboxylesterase